MKQDSGAATLVCSTTRLAQPSADPPGFTAVRATTVSRGRAPIATLPPHSYLPASPLCRSTTTSVLGASLVSPTDTTCIVVREEGPVLNSNESDVQIVTRGFALLQTVSQMPEDEMRSTLSAELTDLGVEVDPQASSFELIDAFGAALADLARSARESA